MTGQTQIPGRDKVIACPYCASQALEPLYREVRDRLGVSNETWNWQACRDCGAGVLSPRPKAEALPHFYPQHYSFEPTLKRGWLSTLETRLFYLPEAKARTDVVRALFRDHAGREAQTLLEVGCGSGTGLPYYANAGIQVEAVDFDERKVAYVRDTWNVPALQASADALPSSYPLESFDIIVAFHLLEHMPDPLAVLAYWREFLAPGGCVIVGVPMADSIAARIFGRRWACVTEAPRHLTLPTRAGLEAAFTRAGYADFTLRADNALSSAADMTLSLMPAATHAKQSSSSALLRVVKRAASMVIMLMCLPLASLFAGMKRPVYACACAFKPAE